MRSWGRREPRCSQSREPAKYDWGQRVLSLEGNAW